MKQDLKLKCEYCEKIFGYKKTFQNHVNRFHLGKAIKCELCCKEVSLNNIKRHRETVHTEVRVKCKFCAKLFKSNDSLNSHVKSLHLTPKVKCEYCEIVVNANYFEKHQMLHMGMKFDCEICGKSYPRKMSLSKHIETKHSNKPKWTCELCGIQCSNQSKLRNHKAVVHPQTPIPKIWKCDLCEKSFAFKRYLNTAPPSSRVIILQTKVYKKF